MRVFAKSLLAVVAAVFFLTSCGGGSDVCNCLKLSVDMLKEAKALDFDQSKMKDLEGKYKPKMEACEAKLGEGKSEEDKKKMEEEAKKCSSYKEMETLMEDMQKVMKQKMEDAMKEAMPENNEEGENTEEGEKKEGDGHDH